MALENLKIAKPDDSISCKRCGKTNDGLRYFVLRNDSKELICLGCLIKETPKWKEVRNG